MAASIVTLLFTDLVGSTDLYQRLGDEAAELLRRRHFRALRDAVASLGGLEVKNLGDGLMVVFESPADAVACAVAMQQAVDRQGSDDGLAVRVGLHVGEPIRDEDDYFGTPVAIAKRLCDVADGGQIFASELVRALVGPRGTFEFRALGPLELKGVAEPVVAAEVLWEPVGAQRIPLPPALDVSDMLALVGREVESEQLKTAYKQAAEGRRVLVLIGGEPGIGKTRLVTEFARWAHEEGACVLYGRCDEEVRAPYQSIVEALGYAIRTMNAEALRRAMGRHVAHIAQLIPEVVERLPRVLEPVRGDPESERLRLYEAISSLLRSIGDSAPAVVVLDDLHWADAPTLAVLRHTVRDADPGALLIIGTYRETELARTHPLADVLAEFRRDEDYVVRIALKGLDIDGVIALVESAAGGRVESRLDELIQPVWEVTEGNPFFVRQVLRHLVETGALVQETGKWVASGSAPIGLPEGVKEVIGRRLSRLDDGVNQLLRVASVIGREFDLDVLCAASGNAEDDALRAIEHAVEARVVEEIPAKIDRFGFTHALVRETLHEELTTSRRVRLHRAVAEAIENLRADNLESQVTQLAYHYGEAAITGDVTKAVQYSKSAGDQALGHFAFDEAARHFERGLEQLEDGSAALRAGLLLGLAEALTLSKGTEAARPVCLQAMDLARELGDPEMVARSALRYAGWLGVPGVVDPQVVALLEEGLNALGDGHPALSAAILSRMAVEVYFDTPRDRSVELNDRALSLAREAGDSAALARALWMRGWHLLSSPDVPQRLAVCDELERSAREAGEGWLAAWGASLRMYAHVVAGDFEAAQRALADYEALTDEYRIRDGPWFRVLWRAMFAIFEGRLDEAESLVNQVLLLGQELGNVYTANQYMAQLFTLRFEQGRGGEMELMFQALIEVDPEIPWRGGLLLQYVDSDKLDEAQSELDILGRNDFGDIPLDGNHLVALALCAYGAVRLRDRDKAQILLEKLKPWDGLLIVVGTPVLILGAASAYLGMLEATLGRWDEAEKHAEEARALHMRLGSQTWVARTDLEFGRLLLERGRPEDVGRARNMLADARELAGRIGQRNVEQTAERLLEGIDAGR